MVLSDPSLRGANQVIRSTQHCIVMDAGALTGGTDHGAEPVSI